MAILGSGRVRPICLVEDNMIDDCYCLLNDVAWCTTVVNLFGFATCSIVFFFGSRWRWETFYEGSILWATRTQVCGILSFSGLSVVVFRQCTPTNGNKYRYLLMKSPICVDHVTQYSCPWPWHYLACPCQSWCCVRFIERSQRMTNIMRCFIPVSLLLL